MIAVLGGLLGLYVAGYTGVLLAVTNRPVWADTPLLGMLLVVSAMSISAALLLLLARGSRQRLPGVAALRRIDVQVIVLELLVLVALVVSLGPAARRCSARPTSCCSSAPSLLGIAAPLALHWRKDWLGERSVAAAAVLVLAGGFLLRAFIVFSPYGAQS